jgi:hypothetical protein
MPITTLSSGPGRTSAPTAARRLVLALALLILPALAMAQAPAAAKGGVVKLASLAIEIWPEYDRPAALVILRGVVAEGVKLPAAISLRLPLASGGPGAVAFSATADGNLLNLKYEKAKSGDSIVVKFETPERYFHIEFYEPIATTDPARTFRYVWPGDIAVERANVVVQEPAAALGMATEPSFEQTSQGQEGLNYRIGDLGALPAGKAVPITVKYTKSDARPSTEIKGIRTAQAAPPSATAPSAPVPVPPPSADGTPAWALPLAGLVGLALVGVLLILWAWRRQSKAAPAAASAAAGFCKKCGAPLAAGSNFCGKCGAKVA